MIILYNRKCIKEVVYIFHIFQHLLIYRIKYMQKSDILIFKAAEDFVPISCCLLFLAQTTVFKTPRFNLNSNEHYSAQKVS